jgi:hypothetical protein
MKTFMGLDTRKFRQLRQQSIHYEKEDLSEISQINFSLGPPDRIGSHAYAVAARNMGLARV